MEKNAKTVKFGQELAPITVDSVCELLRSAGLTIKFLQSSKDGEPMPDDPEMHLKEVHGYVKGVGAASDYLFKLAADLEKQVENLQLKDGNSKRVVIDKVQINDLTPTPSVRIHFKEEGFGSVLLTSRIRSASVHEGYTDQDLKHLDDKPCRIREGYTDEELAEEK